MPLTLSSPAVGLLGVACLHGHDIAREVLSVTSAAGYGEGCQHCLHTQHCIAQELMQVIAAGELRTMSAVIKRNGTSAALAVCTYGKVHAVHVGTNHTTVTAWASLLAVNAAEV